MILRASPPSGTHGVSAFFRVLPTQTAYKTSLRYQIRSRPWSGHYDHCSLQLLRTEKIEKVSMISVKPKTDYDSKMDGGKDVKLVRMTVSDRAPTGKPKPKKRHIPEISLVFNTQHDPCLKYSLDLMKDAGMEESNWTSARLKREVFYFETKAPVRRFELSREPQSTSKYDQYRWLEVNVPQLPLHSARLDIYDRSDKGGALKKRKLDEKAPGSQKQPSLPLDLNADKPYILPNLLMRNLDWDELEWNSAGVSVRGKPFELYSVTFRQLPGQQGK
jgi:hypothetical protein